METLRAEVLGKVAARGPGLVAGSAESRVTVNPITESNEATARTYRARMALSGVFGWVLWPATVTCPVGPGAHASEDFTGSTSCCGPRSLCTPRAQSLEQRPRLGGRTLEPPT
jgi:hypothetical protein